jgi:adenosylcobinamide kinase/adenosylcobinamide-phosphate guanylyltransferase
MLIYVTGGARSGKSRFAMDLARRMAKRVVFVATSWPSDEDWRRRIKRHRQERPKHWRTLENPVDLAKMISEQNERTELLLVDCLTLYVSGRLMEGEEESKISKRVEKFCQAAAVSPITTILVSNEVGSGLVPTTELGRQFRDVAGRANQIVAQYAQKAYVLISGIPLVLKEAAHDE